MLPRAWQASCCRVRAQYWLQLNVIFEARKRILEKEIDFLMVIFCGRLSINYFLLECCVQACNRAIEESLNGAISHIAAPACFA